MKSLIDAQLPSSLRNLFIAKGYDCLHTLDLEQKNCTSDQLINLISVNEQRIVITKDSDFYDSLLIKQEPYKLILVKLGNTSKSELLQFFSDRFDDIIQKIEEEPLLILIKT